MFNKALLSPDARLSEDDGPVVILPEDVILYLPLTGNFLDYGYYELPFQSYMGAAWPPFYHTDGWAVFTDPGNNTYGSTTNSTTKQRTSAHRGMIFNHPAFNAISNEGSDFTIEFLIRVNGDTATGGQGWGSGLKVFPFSFVGAATGSSTAHAVGDQLELGMTLGSHQAPGGFGFGTGPAGTSLGVAVACTSDDTDPNSYINRGVPAIPAGGALADVWGPHYIAIVRKNGVVTFYINGKKLNSPFARDENGDGVDDPNSTWSWDTFSLNTQVVGFVANEEFTTSTGTSGVTGEYAPIDCGFFVGGCWTYSSYGIDDSMYLRHFRVTTKARYTEDYVPEAIYVV